MTTIFDLLKASEIVSASEHKINVHKAIKDLTIFDLTNLSNVINTRTQIGFVTTTVLHELLQRSKDKGLNIYND